MLKLANQNYYNKLPNPSQEVPPFSFQHAVTACECSDLTFIPRILTLDFIQKQIEKGVISKKDLKTNLKYKLLIENQFGLFPSIEEITSERLSSILFPTLQKYLTPEGNFIGPSPYHIFLARLPYSIFYFPFAKSIWRIDENLQYFIPENQKQLVKRPKTEIYLTLDDLQKLGYSEEEIRKFEVFPWETEFINF